MKKTTGFISGIMTLILGILFVILQNRLVNIAICVVGVFLIIMGIIDMVRARYIMGLLKIILAIVVLVFGWFIIDIWGIIIGVILLLYGVLTLIRRIKAPNKTKRIFSTVIGFIESVLCIIGAIFLISGGMGEVISWAIIVAGVIFIIEGILAIFGALVSRR